MNWNNVLLVNGQPFANANNGMIAISWFDMDGIDIIDDKLVDLKFKYDGEKINLNFGVNCEITDTAGIVIPANYINGFVVENL